MAGGYPPGLDAAVAGRKVVLCVGGGIAAYKVVHVARSLSRAGAEVHVAMTEAGRRFVGEQTFAGVTGRPVVTGMFTPEGSAPHVELARGCDLVLVAPATADLLAKMAAGLADDVVSATLLSVSCPVIAAPAMHAEMWNAPATRDNVERLQSRGVRMVGPEEGELMSGDVGPGRMAEPGALLEAVVEVLGRGRDLAGRTVVVTAGGTQEPIDPVRFIGNRSSGLMGYAIAAEAARRGAEVTLVSGPTNLEVPPGVEVVRVQTAEEMRAAVLERAPRADAVIKAAAVADFRPDTSSPVKLKKAAGPPEVRLVPTPDILAELGSGTSARKPGSVLVGFAAETEQDVERLKQVARDKLASKGADVIVANEVGRSHTGFGARTNRAVIATASEVTDVGLVTKEALARALLDEVAKLLAERAT